MAGVRHSPINYRLVVRGRLPVGVVDELPGFAAQVGLQITTLSGPLADASALYGLIARLETLGLTLLSVHPVPAHDHDPEGS